MTQRIPANWNDPEYVSMPVYPRSPLIFIYGEDALLVILFFLLRCNVGIEVA